MRNKRLVFAVVALTWSAILFGGGWLGRTYLDAWNVARAATIDTHQATAISGTLSVNPILDEVWAHVREGFVSEVPSDTVRNYGAVRGALATLQDRYTVFIEPQPHAVERDRLRGQFGGIGVDLRLDANGKIILTPHPDSPAQNAGIRAGDILFAIDGVPVPDKPDFNDIAARVRGDAGTAVHIAVLRNGGKLEFTITRANIAVPSVEWHIITSTQAGKSTIGYIAIHQFTERTSSEVKQAIVELGKLGSQAYLIDLRDNGGGLLNAAVDVTGQFVKDGLVLVEQRRNQADIKYPVSGGGLAYTEPVAVLINGNTASAAEIVAGAIQDHGRGKLIGQKSFGKGSVQSIYDLSDGSSVHITSARWLTPNRRTIDGQGLVPDIDSVRAAGEAEQGKDTQLDRGVAELQNVLGR